MRTCPHRGHARISEQICAVSKDKIRRNTVCIARILDKDTVQICRKDGCGILCGQVLKEKQKSKPSKLLIVLIIILVLALIAFGGYQIYRYPAMFRKTSDNSLSAEHTEQLKQEILAKDNVNVLVAYYSYSGTTKDIAEQISTYMNSDIFEIKTQEEYSNVYMESNSQIRKKELPQLVGSPDNLDEYDIVFVGFPVWWHATPTPINAFLESNDLKGKLIIPFCTSGGSDIDEPLPTFLDSCDGLAVYGGRTMNSTSAIPDWISELGLNELSQNKSDSNVR